VVQRIQRYAQSSVFKRSVLQGIAQELLDSSPSGTFQEVACPVDLSGLGKDVNHRPVLAAPCNSPLNAILALLHVDGKEQVRAWAAAWDGLLPGLLPRLPVGALA
jgi:hypothetical protein